MKEEITFPRPIYTAIFLILLDSLFLRESGLSFSDVSAIATKERIIRTLITVIVKSQSASFLNDDWIDKYTNRSGIEFVITFFGDE